MTINKKLVAFSLLLLINPTLARAQQRVTVTSIAAGTNNIGDVDVATIAAGDNNIGNVDVVTLPSVTIGTFPDNEPINVAQMGGLAVSPCMKAAISSVPIDTASAGNVQLVAISGSTVIYGCGFSFMASGTVNVQLIKGTGTACATGEADLTGPYPLVVNTGISVANGGAVQFATVAGDALCIELSAAVQVSGMFTYVQQ